MENDKNYFNNLEELLQQKADSFIIYPKDTTWEEIKTSLHGTTKWPALGIIFMFIVVVLTITTALNYPPEPILAKYQNTLPNIYSKQIVAAKRSKPTKTFVQLLDTRANNTETFNATISKNQYRDTIQNQVAKVEVDILETQKVNKVNQNSENTIVQTPINLVQKTVATPTLDSLNDNATVNLSSQNIKKDNILSSQEVELDFKNKDETNPDASDYLKEFEANFKVKSKKHSKWLYQLYITPSISDRILFDDKERILYTQPTTSAAQNLRKNINEAIQYTPAMGSEIGVGFLYNVSKNVHFKTGFQFNIRQYVVDAYRGFNTATIAFVNNNALDSINFISLFSTNRNSYSAALNNKLYQVSIPIGIQWDFLNIKNFGINVAATVQPTFTLNKNVYVVSTDYKFYADGQSFFRNVNLNSAVEINFTLKQGKKQWFLGPQLRYQHLPTYNNLYPIKEYRLDYGLRIGFNAPL